MTLSLIGKLATSKVKWSPQHLFSILNIFTYTILQPFAQLIFFRPTLTLAVFVPPLHTPRNSTTMAADAAAATKRPLKPASTANKAYLIFYNSVSALLWSVVLGRTVMLLGLHGPEYVYPNVGEFTKWTQTLAGLEVMHSLLGMIYFYCPSKGGTLY